MRTAGIVEGGKSVRLLRSFAVAFSMYSRLPMPQWPWEEGDLEYVFCFFPAIGLVEGLFLLCWMMVGQMLGLGSLMLAAGLVVLPLLVTGGIHMDGFCDMADALASHQSRERKLEILKDSHTGAFAVIACGTYLVFQFALWHQGVTDHVPWMVVLLTPVLSRSLSGIAVVTCKNARGSGMLATFSNAVVGKRVLATLVVWFMAAGVLLIVTTPVCGTAAVVGALAVYGYYMYVAHREFGGVTGDLAGWFLQLCEVGCLLAAVLAGKVAMLL